MGANGPAIFSDDLACDIRAEFRELIGDGLTPTQATDKIVSNYSQSGIPTDPDDGPNFWIALAATQWKCGRLLDSVKEKALASIQPDLERWRTSAVGDARAIAKMAEKRRAVLETFRAAILSPQPEPTRIRKLFRDQTAWEVGHFVSYRLKSERLIVLRILGIYTDDKCRLAMGDMCDWIGEEPPPSDLLAIMKRKHTKYFDRDNRFHLQHDGKLMLCALGPRDYPAERLCVVATNQPVEECHSIGVSHFGGWKHFDAYLKSYFEIE